MTTPKPRTLEDLYAEQDRIGFGFGDLGPTDWTEDDDRRLIEVIDVDIALAHAEQTTGVRRSPGGCG